MNSPSLNWHRVGGVESDGMVGGDRQVGDAWSVRFHCTHAREDGLHAVATVHWYVEESDSCRMKIVRHIEYVLCTDPEHPGDTEHWSDAYDARMVPTYTSAARAEAVTRALADETDASILCWDGQGLPDVPFGVEN